MLRPVFNIREMGLIARRSNKVIMSGSPGSAQFRAYSAGKKKLVYSQVL